MNSIQRSNSNYPLDKCLPLSINGMLTMPQRLLGGEMGQNYGALYFLEHYIDYHKFDYVVELGTSYGALSLYLMNMAEVTEQFLFHTFEINTEIDFYNRSKGGVGHWFDSVQKIAKNSKMFVMNVFSPETVRIISENMKERKTLIFCDNGDKAREFNMLCPLLKSGDCIATHDWNTGIFYYQIDNAIRTNGLELDQPWSDNCEELKNLIRPFRKK